MNEYDKQAKEFLDNTKTEVKISRYPASFAPEANWSPAGACYRVTLTRGDKKYSFNFWGSVQMLRDHKHPTAYDVLACLDDYVDTSMSIDEFAETYGYTKISKAIKAHNASIEQTMALRDMFDDDELEMLRDIN